MSSESRRIASLLLSDPDEATWRQAVEIENILQKKAPASQAHPETVELVGIDPVSAQGGEVVDVGLDDVRDVTNELWQVWRFAGRGEGGDGRGWR